MCIIMVSGEYHDGWNIANHFLALVKFCPISAQNFPVWKRTANFKMADSMVGDEVQWFSAELRILEAEYEKSKLRVFQDTLLCKRSMVELELLCKNEQLRKNTRDSNKIKEHEYQLKVQFKNNK